MFKLFFRIISINYSYSFDCWLLRWRMFSIVIFLEKFFTGVVSSCLLLDSLRRFGFFTMMDKCSTWGLKFWDSTYMWWCQGKGPLLHLVVFSGMAKMWVKCGYDFWLHIWIQQQILIGNRIIARIKMEERSFLSA